MTVTVVVPVSGRPVHLARTLGGLADQRRRPDRTVVVDMGHADLRDAPIPVQHVVLPVAGSALPLAAARNLGAAHGGEGHLVFLDVDCIPHPDLIGDHVAALDRIADVVACGRVRYLRQGWAEEPAPVDLDVHSDPHPARPMPLDDLLDADRHELFWSLNFAVTTVTWRRLGGFDVGYRGYGAEDTDLGLRAAEAGIPLLWVAGATAYHQWHPPSRLDPARLPEIVANARRFRTRWGRWPMAGWLADLAAAGAVRFDPGADVLEVVER
jgi:GT2 family glycosyltransferase